MDPKLSKDEQDFIDAYQEDDGGSAAGDNAAAGADNTAAGGDGAGAADAGAGTQDGGEDANAAAMAKAAKDAAGGGGEQPGAKEGAAGAKDDADAASSPADGEANGDAAKDAQREKSWEGRLKARERELESREAKLREAEAKLKDNPEKAADAIEKVADKAEKKGDEELAETASDLAEQVEDGSMSVAEAMKQLREDFGDSFMDMLSIVVKDLSAKEADRISDEKVGGLEGRTKDAFSAIGQRHSLLHREKIEEAFPDVDDIASSQAFQDFKATYPDGEKIATDGSARQVIKMLKAFKDSDGAKDEQESKDSKDSGTSQAGKDQIDRDAGVRKEQEHIAEAPPSEAAIDAAAGVRSSGAVKVPDAPAESGDYAGAWAAA